MGPNVNKFAFLAIQGGGGGVGSLVGPKIIRLGPYSQLSSHLCQATYGSNRLSYRVHKEMSADKAERNDD